MPLDALARERVIRTILAEAGKEPPEGQMAVANVIKNRTLSGVWGDPYVGGVSRVIFAHHQFSPWNQDDPKMQAYMAKVLSIPTSDPSYQRAGQIADYVFSDQNRDNTGGATHFYAPSGMPGGQPPDWAVGQNGQRIGTQIFYRLPLTASNTAGTGITSPSMVPPSAAPQPAAPTASAAAASITPIQAFTGGDYGREATAGAQPFKGIVLHIAGKPDLQSELAYSSAPDAGRGNAYFGYHYLIDRDGKVYQTAPDNVRTNHIMPNTQFGLNNSNAIGVSFIGGAPAGKAPLPPTPAQIAAGNALVDQLKAKYGIASNMIVSHGELDPGTRGEGSNLNSDGGAEAKDFITAYRAHEASTPAAAPTVAAPAAEANKPAPQAQPVAAVAPAGSAATPGSAQNPPAGAVGAPDPNARFQVLQGMTGGGQAGRNPMLYTALNLAPGAGTPAPAAAAPAAPSASSAPTPYPGGLNLAPSGNVVLSQGQGADAGRAVPIPMPPSRPAAFGVNQGALASNPPTPPPRPPDVAPAGPAAPAQPIASVLPTVGASQPYDAGVPSGQGQFMPGGGGRFPARSANAPSMGYPALGAPPSTMPNPLYATAQNLLRLLYPQG